MAPLAVELTAEGSLRLPAAVAERFFPSDAMVARVVERELWLIPVRGGGGGGLMLKIRNRAGDRAVVIREVLPAEVGHGDLPAFWDEPRGTLRIALGPPQRARRLHCRSSLMAQPPPDRPLFLAAGPQPLGIFPPPAGFLLLPDSASPLAAEALARLLAADLSGPLPAEWEFYRRAAAGDLAGALAGLGPPDDSVLAYDRFVLSGDLGAFAGLPGLPSGDLGRLIVCAAFAAGESDGLPDAEGALDPTVAGVAWMVRAAAEMETGESAAALASLGRGIEAARAVSPSLAAQLLAQQAALLLPDDRKGALAALRAALALAPAAPEGGRSPVRAALYLALGERLQDAAAGDRSGLLEAVKAYQAAIHSGLSLDHEAESYALAQNNLGLAYLALPMSEAGSPLRLGVAVQSFREALKVWTPERNPEGWASAQLNLANALQYLPSSHPEENLAQAVEIYEQLLGVRNRAFDPLGYARLIANQANALAHLGIFAPALAKLEEAHKLFHWHGEPELAASALEQVERINERLGAAVAEGG